MKSGVTEKYSEKQLSINKAWLYRLTLQIHRGTQLPIADVTTSDPYVIVDLNDRNIGKTHTLYRTTEPVWETTLSDIYLTHIDHTLILRVMDEDRDKNDDPLGTVSIPLRSKAIIFNIKNQLSRDLAQIEGSKIIASGSIQFSILLEKNTNIISIVSKPITLQQYNPLLHPTLEQELLRVNAPESVISTLKSWDGKYITIDEQWILRDLLLDTCSIADLVKIPGNTKSLISTGAIKSATIIPMHVKKPVKISKTNYASEYNCVESTIIRSAPHLGFQITLVMTSNDRHIIVFPNSYLLWIWIRTIRYICDIMNKREYLPSLLPSWISSGVLLTKDVTLHYHSSISTAAAPFRSATGTLSLSIIDPNPSIELINSESRGIVFTIPVSEISKYIMNNNSLCSGQYLAQVEVVSCRIHGEDHNKDSNVKSGDSRDPHFQFHGDVNTLIANSRDYESNRFVPVVSTSSGWCVGFLCGTVTLTTNAAHIARAGVGVVTEAVATVSEALKVSYHLIIKGVGTFHRTSDRFLTKSMTWNESLYIDFDYEAKSIESAMITSVVSENGSGVDDNAGIYMFLYKSHISGTGSQDTLLGCKYTNIREYLMKNQHNGEVNVDMNDKISFNLSITSIELNILPLSNGPANDLAGKFHCICKFVKANGAKVGKYRLSKIVPRSTLSNGLRFICQDFDFVLTEADGLDEAEYVRIDIRFESSLFDDRIASAYIPIESFHASSCEISLPLTLLKHHADTTNKLWSKGFIAIDGSYGTIKTKISRTISRFDTTTANGKNPPSLVFRYNIEEQNMLTSFWPAETVVGSDLSSEKFLFGASYDNLMLLDPMDSALLYGHQIRVTKTGDVEDEAIDFDDIQSSNATSKATIKPITDIAHDNINLESVRVNLGLDIEIIVLENQRNIVTFYSKEHLFTHDFAPFSDEEGRLVANVDHITEILPPYGYHWENDWALDFSSETYVDEDGWRYGSEFKGLMKKSFFPVARAFHTVPNKELSLVRSRRWVRRAHRIERHMTSTRDINQNLIYPEYLEPHSTSSSHKHRYNWRDIMMREFPSRIISCCKERSTLSSAIHIPFNQVLSYVIVTDSIISVNIQVNRYMGKTGPDGEPQYRPVDSELFIENCKAHTIKILLDERCEFSRIRQTLRTVFDEERDVMLKLRKHDSVGRFRKESLTKAFSSLHYDMDDSQSSSPASPSKQIGIEEDENENINENNPPVTSELSPGCLILQDIDGIYVSLQVALTSEVQNKAPERDIRLLEARLLRVKLYYALLLGVASRVTDKSKYQPKVITDMVTKDIQICQSIEGLDEIELAVNRMEYLFDIAESRILDYALHGWQFQSKNLSLELTAAGTMEFALHYLLNEYFTQLVGSVGKYFESVSSSQTYLKGLQRKIILLIAFMKYNDRLDQSISTALRLYNLSTSIVPRLSTILKINVLIALYANILQEDMGKAVDSAVNVWKDTKKNVSGNLEFYAYAIPWIPMRSNHTEGYFYTLIPQDAVNYLLEYLSLARVDEEGIAPSFLPILDIVESRVQLSFAWSLKYLCDMYWNTLERNFSDWIDRTKIICLLKDTLLYSSGGGGGGGGGDANISNNNQATRNSGTTPEDSMLEEQIFRFLDEKCDWLCSVANDANRVTNSELLNIPKPKTKKSKKSLGSTINMTTDDDLDVSEIQTSKELEPRIESLLEDTTEAFHELEPVALDMLCCLTMQQLSLEFNSIFNASDLYLEWKKHLSDHILYKNHESSRNPDVPKRRKSIVVQPCLFMIDFIDALVDVVEKQRSFLLQTCYIRYVELCLDKVISMFYLLLIDAYTHNTKWLWHSPEVTQLYLEVKHLHKGFESIGMPLIDTAITTVDAQSGSSTKSTKKMTIIESRLIVLEHMIMFLRAKRITKIVLQEVFEPVLAIAPHRRAVAEDITMLLQLTVALRLDVDWMNEEERDQYMIYEANHLNNDASHHSSSLFHFSKHNHSERLNLSGVTPKKRRSSFLAAFGFGGRNNNSTESITETEKSLDVKITPSIRNLASATLEIDEINANLANEIDNDGISPDTMLLHDDSQGEPVDIEIINSFISSIAAWKLRTGSTANLMDIEHQEPSSTKNSNIYHNNRNPNRHTHYYFCAEVLIRIVYHKREILCRNHRFKTTVQALVLLPAHGIASKEVELAGSDLALKAATKSLPLPSDGMKKLSSPSIGSESKLGTTFVTEYVLELSDLYVTDVFFIDYSKPSVYVEFELKFGTDAFKIASSVKHDGTAPDWRHEKPLELVIAEDDHTTHDGSNALRTVLNASLIGSLRYKGHLFGHLDVGVFKINISAVDINPIQGEYVIDTSQSDSKIQKAAKKALSLPGTNPTKVGVTVRLIQRQRPVL